MEGYHLPVVTAAESVADSATEEGTLVVFTVTRAGDSSEALDVFFTIEDNSGVLESQAPTSATIDADESSVSLPILDDEVDEPNADVSTVLQDSANYPLGTPSQAAVTARDNDGIPTVFFVETDATVTEGGTLEFPVMLSNPSDLEIPVRYTIRGTAEAEDYNDSGNGCTERDGADDFAGYGG